LVALAVALGLLVWNAVGSVSPFGLTVPFGQAADSFKYGDRVYTTRSPACLSTSDIRRWADESNQELFRAGWAFNPLAFPNSTVFGIRNEYWTSELYIGRNDCFVAYHAGGAP